MPKKKKQLVIPPATEKEILGALQAEIGNNDDIYDIFRLGGRKLFDSVYTKVEGVFEKYRKQYARTITKSEQGNGNALPVGTRFFRQNQRHAIFVIEQKPQVRTIKVEPEQGNSTILAWRGGNEKDSYHLAMPYLVYFIRCYRDRRRSYEWCDPLLVACRNEPLRSLKDDVYATVFPNVSDLSVCMPHDSDIGKANNVAELCERVIAQFWNTPFSYDGTALLNDLDCKKMPDLTVWERESIKNPLFPLKVKWKRHSTVDDVMSSIHNYSDGDDEDDEDAEFPSELQDASNTALGEVEDFDTDDLEKVIQNAAIHAISVAIRSLATK